MRACRSSLKASSLSASSIKKRGHEYWLSVVMTTPYHRVTGDTIRLVLTQQQSRSTPSRDPATASFRSRLLAARAIPVLSCRSSGSVDGLARFHVVVLLVTQVHGEHRESRQRLSYQQWQSAHRWNGLGSFPRVRGHCRIVLQAKQNITVFPSCARSLRARVVCFAQ